MSPPSSIIAFDHSDDLVASEWTLIPFVLAMNRSELMSSYTDARTPRTRGSAALIADSSPRARSILTSTGVDITSGSKRSRAFIW